MKIRWRYNSKLAVILKVQAIVLYPYIFVKPPQASERLRKHELKHIEQMRREGVVRYYLKYLGYYFKNLAKFKSHQKAYWYIPYEIEAREAETDSTKIG